MNDPAGKPSTKTIATRAVRSLGLAWLLLFPIGAIAKATGIEPPAAVGVALTVTTAAAVFIWSSRTTARPGETSWRAAVVTAAPAVATGPTAAVEAAAQAGLLAVLRMLFVSFVGSVIAVGAVVFIVVPDLDETVTVSISLGAVAAAAAVSILLSLRGPLALDPTSPEALLGSYRSRYMLRLALAQLPALVGFVTSMLSGTALVYLAGALLSAPGFVLAAPTLTNIRRDDARLASTGSAHRLATYLLPQAT